MSALLLYLAVTIAIVVLWHRRVQPIGAVAAIVVVLLPLCFTGRALLTGRIYAPVDLPYMSEPLGDYKADYGVGPVHNGNLSDLYCQIIPWRKAVRWAIAQGEWPLWNPFMLSGDILAQAAQPAPYDPINLLGLTIPMAPSLTFGAAMTFFLAGFFTFAFARLLGLSDLASLVAAAGFMFAAMLAFFVGWPLSRAWSYMPLVLAGVRLVVRDRDVRATVVLTAAFVLVIFAGHPESILHVTFIGALYGVFELFGVRRPQSPLSSREPQLALRSWKAATAVAALQTHRRPRCEPAGTPDASGAHPASRRFVDRPRPRPCPRPRRRPARRACRAGLPTASSQPARRPPLVATRPSTAGPRSSCPSLD